MANIVLTLPEGDSVFDGKQVTFKAPCDCTTPSGLSINGTIFTVVDAAGNNVLGKANKFASGSLISVLLDVTSSKAYILNAVEPISFGTTAGTACEGNDTRLSDARTPKSHNQAASTITAGTFAGQVKANATAQSTLTTAQLRDAVFVAEASAPAVGSTADTSKYPEGCLIVLVEAVS